MARAQVIASIVLSMTACGLPTMAAAQEATRTHATVPSFGELFADTAHDLLRLASRGPATTLAVGGVVSGIAATEDSAVRRELTRSETTDEVLDGGSPIGNGFTQIGAAFGAYALGRATRHAELTVTGADLVQAQLVSGILTQGIKIAVDRQRPDGSKYWFPSGHTSAAFATADIVARRFGWRVGALAYAGGAYIAMSRIAENRHYLSDVLFGAAVGIASSRTVTLHAPHRGFSVIPVALRGGGEIMFSK